MIARYDELTPGEAHDRLASFRVIDVREPHEFDGPLGRVPGSERVVFSTAADDAAVFADEPLLVVCRSGNRPKALNLILGDVSRVALV